jgi:predicted restriction endonuclease
MTLCVMNYGFAMSELVMVQWEEMKDAGFVPQMAKGVEHEVRNGIQLCAQHHRLLDSHCYYIRWMPEVVF